MQYPGKETMTTAMARIATFADRLDNPNSLTAEYAARNIVEGKPAFWHTEGYSNGPAGAFLSEVNRLASIEAGAVYLRGFFPARGYGSVEFLDRLLPLNDAAVDDLAGAYAAAGSFRDLSELIRRTERAEGKSMMEIA